MVKCLTLLGFVVLFLSCKDEVSLQNYLVEKENNSDFISASLPSSLIFQNLDSLSTELNASLQKIKKINLLALTKTKAGGLLSDENRQLNKILANSDYENLMNFKADGRAAKLLYEGDDKQIDELIFYGFDAEMGLLFLRMHGEDLKATDLYNISQSAQQLDLNTLVPGFDTILDK